MSHEIPKYLVYIHRECVKNELDISDSLTFIPIETFSKEWLIKVICEDLMLLTRKKRKKELEIGIEKLLNQEPVRFKSYYYSFDYFGFSNSLSFNTSVINYCYFEPPSVCFGTEFGEELFSDSEDDSDC